MARSVACVAETRRHVILYMYVTLLSAYILTVCIYIYIYILIDIQLITDSYMNSYIHKHCFVDYVIIMCFTQVSA